MRGHEGWDGTCPCGKKFATKTVDEMTRAQWTHWLKKHTPAIPENVSESEPAPPTDGPTESAIRRDERAKVLRELADELRDKGPHWGRIAWGAELSIRADRLTTTQEPPAKEPTP